MNVCVFVRAARIAAVVQLSRVRNCRRGRRLKVLSSVLSVARWYHRCVVSACRIVTQGGSGDSPSPEVRKTRGDQKREQEESKVDTAIVENRETIGIVIPSGERIGEDEKEEGRKEKKVHEEDKKDVEGKMPEQQQDDLVEWENEIVTLDIEEPPPPEVVEYARRELGETDEVKCQTLQELRDMIYERGECLPHNMEDDFLIRFLRARDFNVYRAHRLIVNYCNFKEEHPEIHHNIRIEALKTIGDDDVVIVPVYRTQCGRRMLIYRIGNWDPRKYSVEEIFKATVVVLELGILEPRAQILGGIVIFDFEGITMSHAWTITPQVASMVISLMVAAFPMKTHAIHIINQSWVFDAIFAVFKPLLDTRMQDKVFFHGSNMESLHKHVSPLHLPKKYGGTRSEMHYYEWIKSLSKVPKIVKEMKSLGYVLPEDVEKAFHQA